MAAPADSTTAHRPPALIAVFVVPIIVALALSTFAWTAAELRPRDLPLGLVGPVDVIGPLEQQLAQREATFDLHRYEDEAEARDAIEDRDVYGAVVAAPGGLTLLTAPAASPLVAGILEEAIAAPVEAGAGASGVARARVIPVVPADADDPRGSAFSALVLPLVLSGVIAGVIVSLLGRPGLEQVGILSGAALLAGLVAILMVQGWLEVVRGPWLVNAAVLSLTVLAIASVVAGLAGLIGPAGIGVAAVLMVLIANPWSGVGSAPELLPEPAGLIGQLLPPGAGGNLLRSTAFFDGADAGGHLAVLVIWAALSFGAIVVATLRSRQTGAPAA